MLKADYLQEVPCPLCHQNDFNVVYDAQYPEELDDAQMRAIFRSSSDSKRFDQMVSCNACRMVYLNPRLNQDIILDGYKSAVDDTFVSQNPYRIQTFKKQLRKVARKFEIPQGGKLLDIGSAGGAYLAAASQLGYDAVGIEPSQWMCDFAKNTYQVDIRPGILSDHQFESEMFDLVTLWDVLEHVPDPKEVLEDIFRYLKPGGLLVLTYPNIASLAAKILGPKWPFLLNVHLSYYTPETVSNQLKDVGFDIQNMSPHWQQLSLGYVCKRAGALVRPIRVFEKLFRVLRMYHWPIVYNMGQTMVVSQKPVS
ncbi:MAG: class I SAM-dependent methyltransferase [Candidatus Margulisbacteria bacterium]|nr:class I SAM-dependent methyltransferase [Candidatus Margulisiibacteriota bacterium]